MHGQQSIQRFHPQRAAPHGQIAGFHQRAAQFAGQYHMLEPARIAAPRRQQSQPRAGAPGRCHTLQCRLPGIEERPQLRHFHRPEHFGQHTRHHAAIFQRVAKPRRLVGAVRQHLPITIRRADQVGRVKMQMRRRHLCGARHPARAQIAWARIHKARRQRAVFQQAARPIHISQQGFQQPRPLRQPLGQCRELMFGKQKRYRIAAPLPLAARQ